MDIQNNWPHNRIRPEESEALYDLLMTVEKELDRIDVQADELYEQRFIETATENELEKLASEVNVQRETGESEKKFRFRARIAKAVSRSQGTTPDFAQVLRLIFEDNTTQVQIEPIADRPVTRLTVPSALIDDLPVNKEELEDILRDAIPAGDNIQIVTDDTWLLNESGDQGIEQGGLL